MYIPRVSLSDGALLLALAMERFAERRSWEERELARRIGTREQLQQVLAVLADQGWPLQVDRGVWSVPEGWTPGGLSLSAADLAELLRLLARAPRSRPRDQILSKLTRRIRHGSWVTPFGADQPSDYRSVLEQSARDNRVLEVLYFSRETSVARPRLVSVQETATGARGACWVVSHPSNTATRVLLDSILDVRERPDLPYLVASEPLADPGPLARIRVALSVPRFKTRQLVAALPLGLSVGQEGDTLRVEGLTSALTPLARLVLALGAGIVIESPELRGLVDAIARIALGELGFDPLPAVVPRAP